jgi:hypothetical protein
MTENQNKIMETEMKEKIEKVQFEGIYKRIENTEKRIEDVKWFIGVLITIIIVMSVLFGWNFSSEKDSLRDFEKNLKEELGKSEPSAEIQILNPNGEDINGTKVKVDVSLDPSTKDTFEIIIPHIIKNKGLGSTGPLYCKTYTNAPLITDFKSTDESDFHYELTASPNEFDIKEFPGQFSENRWDVIYLKNGKRPPVGTYLVMIKYFYGKGKVTKATFKIIVPLSLALR